MSSRAIKRQPNTCTAIANGDALRLYDTSAGDERQISVQNLLRKSVTVSAAGPTDTTDVTGCSVVLLDTSSNNVTLGGFTGGVAGQVLQVVNTTTTNSAILEHNETGPDQKVYLQKEADQTIATYGGWTLVCDGSSWFEVNNTAAL